MMCLKGFQLGFHMWHECIKKLPKVSISFIILGVIQQMILSWVVLLGMHWDSYDAWIQQFDFWFINMSGPIFGVYYTENLYHISTLVTSHHKNHDWIQSFITNKELFTSLNQLQMGCFAHWPSDGDRGEMVILMSQQQCLSKQDFLCEF